MAYDIRQKRQLSADVKPFKVDASNNFGLSGGFGLNDQLNLPLSSTNTRLAISNKELGASRSKIKDLVAANPTSPEATLLTIMGAFEQQGIKDDFGKIRESEIIQAFKKQEKAAETAAVKQFTAQLREVFPDKDERAYIQSKVSLDDIGKKYKGDIEGAMKELEPHRQQFALNKKKDILDMEDWLKIHEDRAAFDGIISGLESDITNLNKLIAKPGASKAELAKYKDLLHKANAQLPTLRSFSTQMKSRLDEAGGQGFDSEGATQNQLMNRMPGKGVVAGIRKDFEEAADNAEQVKNLIERAKDASRFVTGAPEAEVKTAKPLTSSQQGVEPQQGAPTGQTEVQGSKLNISEMDKLLVDPGSQQSQQVPPLGQQSRFGGELDEAAKGRLETQRQNITAPRDQFISDIRRDPSDHGLNDADRKTQQDNIRKSKQQKHIDDEANELRKTGNLEAYAGQELVHSEFKKAKGPLLLNLSAAANVTVDNLLAALDSELVQDVNKVVESGDAGAVLADEFSDENNPFNATFDRLKEIYKGFVDVKDNPSVRHGVDINGDNNVNTGGPKAGTVSPDASKGKAYYDMGQHFKAANGNKSGLFPLEDFRKLGLAENRSGDPSIIADPLQDGPNGTSVKSGRKKRKDMGIGVMQMTRATARKLPYWTEQGFHMTAKSEKDEIAILQNPEHNVRLSAELLNELGNQVKHHPIAKDWSLQDKKRLMVVMYNTGYGSTSDKLKAHKSASFDEFMDKAKIANEARTLVERYSR